MKKVLSPQSVGLLAMALAALSTGCQESVLPPPPPPTVTVAPIQEREIQDFVVFTGRTEAMQTVDIRARVSGYLTETLFKDGQNVKKGDVLFIIDPRPYQADLDRAQAEFDRAQADLQLAAIEFNRSRELRMKNAISAQDFDGKSAAYLKAQAGQASAKAALDTSKLNLEFTSIKSPIDGQASRASVTPGNLVTPDSKDPLTVIVSTSPIYAYADIDERQLLRYIRMMKKEEAADPSAKAKNGDDSKKTPIGLQLADEKEFAHEGVIDFADNRVNASTGTISLRGVFQDKEDLLAPGMFVRLRLPGSAKYKSVLVPQEAIGIDQGQRFVYVVKPDGVVDQRRVEPGAIQDDGWRAVKGALTTGERVIVEGMMKAQPGEKVTAKPWEPASQTGAQPASQTTPQASPAPSEARP